MSARADTWMPFYIGDYLRDTPHLKTEQHGAYLLLLFACWARGGALPNDDDQLAAITRLDAKAWQRHRGVLLAFFETEGETLRQKRITKEILRSQTITQRRAETGKAGAAKRWQTDSKPDGKPPPEKWQTDGPSQSQSQPLPPIGERGGRASRLPPDFIVPLDWLDEASEARKRHKLPPTNLALQAERFVNHWTAQGRNGAKTNWHRTWLNWATSEKGSANGTHPRPTGFDSVLAGADAALHRPSGGFDRIADSVGGPLLGGSQRRDLEDQT